MQFNKAKPIRHHGGQNNRYGGRDSGRDGRTQQVVWKYHAKDVPPDLNKIVDNRSLYFDKYAFVADREGDVDSKNETLRFLISKQTPTDLCKKFSESRRWMALVGMQFKLCLAARMAVNHTGGVVENAGLALDRFTGEPYIPCSALKGIARVGATIKDASEEEKTLVFGYEKESSPSLGAKGIENFAGLVAFLPAYSSQPVKLEIDILTCHYMDYYGGRKPKALDTEAPNPQKFPVVPAGTEFIFTIIPINREKEWIYSKLNIPKDFDPLIKAKEYLETGLKEHGIGAKTAAGYGWFTDKLENFGGGKGVKSALDSVSDYKTDEIFKNRVINILNSPGQYNLLKKEIELLKKPNNREYLEKLKKYIAENKEVRKRLKELEWFPKEWLGL